MSKAQSSRVTSIKTPGAAAADPADFDDVGSAGEVPGKAEELDEGAPEAPAELPPDLQAMIAAEVAKGVAKEMAKQRRAIAAPEQPAGRLPTHAEAMAMVKTKGGRAVLSQDGYVCQDPRDADVKRDINGFAAT